MAKALKNLCIKVCENREERVFLLVFAPVSKYEGFSFT